MLIARLLFFPMPKFQCDLPLIAAEQESPAKLLAQDLIGQAGFFMSRGKAFSANMLAWTEFIQFSSWEKGLETSIILSIWKNIFWKKGPWFEERFSEAIRYISDVPKSVTFFILQKWLKKIGHHLCMIP